MEFLKQSRGIIFGYEIDVFSYHKNPLYSTTLSESQRVILWQLIIEEFGTNIQHISGVDNILSDAIGRFPSTPSNKYEPCTRKSQCRSNELFALIRIENNEDCFPLNLLIVQRKQQK